MTDNNPKVGVGVIIRKGDKVLFGKRKNSHGDGAWAFPGGHLEFGESVEECAKREVEEETGLILGNFKKVFFTNDIFKKENKHYVTLFVLSEWKEGEPEVMEPEKCERWEWFDWSNLPQPLFVPVENLIKEGFDPLC